MVSTCMLGERRSTCMLGSERAVRTPKEACVLARLPKAGLGAVFEMRGAIRMQSACVHARLPKAGLGAVLERLMRWAIRMQSACVQARLPKAGLGSVLEMRGAIRMQSACVQARLPKAGLGAVLERPVEGGRVVVGDVREPQVRCEHERLMRGEISMQSACNQHALRSQAPGSM